MNKNLLNQLIVVLLVLNLIGMMFFNISLANKVYDLRGDVRNLEYQLSNEFRRMEDNVVYQIMESIEESNSLIESLEYGVKSFDAARMNVVYSVELLLKEPKADSVVKWVYEGNESSGETILTYDGNLKYSSEVSLSIKDNYRINIIEESLAGERMLNKDEIRIELKDRYLDHRVRHMAGSGSNGSKSFSEENYFTLNMLDESVYGIEKAEVLVFKDNQLLDTINVTDEIFVGDDISGLREKLYSSGLYVSGESAHHNAYSEATVMESKGGNDGVDLFDQYYILHFFYGEYEDYNSAQEDHLHIRYRFTFKDGYVYDEY